MILKEHILIAALKSFLLPESIFWLDKMVMELK